MISAFVIKAKMALDYLIDKKIASKIALAGLSRGALLCFHIAAICPWIQHVLAFAPLIDLGNLSEFLKIKEREQVQNLHPNNLAPFLTEKEIRMYIGNNDTRVGTKNAFFLIEKLVEEANKSKKKCPFELIIYPSIGYKGHGTDEKTFKEGCLWLKEKLLESDLQP